MHSSRRTAAAPRLTPPPPTPRYVNGQRYLDDNATFDGAASQHLRASGSSTSLVMSDHFSHSAQDKKARGAQWLANSNKVLCFIGYFQEAVHESLLENYRIRKVQLFYYLEDDTMQITELKMENSGVPQGNFLKRHRVRKEEEDCFYTLDDLRIGKTIELYGRVFQIVDASKATVAYLAARGVEMDAPQPFPVDEYEATRNAIMSRETGGDANVSHNIRKNPMKIFAEAALGNTVNNSNRAGFLQYDRKVLRFQCVWDDRDNLYGDIQYFKVHYFLTDDTMEVLSVYGPNSGRDPFPVMLKRGKLPKGRFMSASEAKLADADPEQYHWTDFAIGNTLQVYSRTLMLVDADDSTRGFYESQGRDLGPPIEPDLDHKPTFERKLPPYTGFGTDEDSLTSCVGSLCQVAPTRKLGSSTVLRFCAKLDHNKAEDQGRVFVVQYFLADHTIMIREPPRRNSGIIGGNFLSRMKVKDEFGDPIPIESFYVGNTVMIMGHPFNIYEADKATETYIRENFKPPAAEAKEEAFNPADEKESFAF